MGQVPKAKVRADTAYLSRTLRVISAWLGSAPKQLKKHIFHSHYDLRGNVCEVLHECQTLWGEGGSWKLWSRLLSLS